MSDSPITIASRDGVVVLTFAHPEKRNAMTSEMTTAFRSAIERVARDAEARVLVMGNQGSTFSAGGDLATLESQLDWDAERNRRFMAEFYRQYLSVAHLDIPTIAAMSGHAIGAGLCIAMACDIRIASSTARFGVTFLNLGLHPGMGTTFLLPELVNHAHAAELVFTGKLISGEKAKEIGLVNHAVPAERVDDMALSIAREIASKPASAMRMAKRALVRSRLRELESALDYEAAAQMSSFASLEMRESVAEVRSNLGKRHTENGAGNDGG